MANRDKYDVMADESNGLYFSLIMFHIKAWNFRRKVKSGKISGDMIELERVNLITRMIPYIKKTAHICYENYKDLLQINSDEILSYLEFQKIDSNEFLENYSKNINEYVSLLLFFAIHDRDKVKFDLDSRIILLKIMGNSETDISTLNLNKFSDESKNMITKILLPDFDIKKLTSDEMEFLDAYHQLYMEPIYFCVTDMSDIKKRVLSEAVNLSERRK